MNINRRLCLSLALLLLVFSFLPAHGEEPVPYRLTLEEAIQKGLAANVSVLVAGTRVMEAEGTRERRLSALLPRARIETPFSYQSVNLEAQGLTFPNMPTKVGPFKSWDFRAYADQPLLDLQSYHNLKASNKDQTVFRSSYQDARNLVVRQVAGLYLNAQSALAAADAAASRVKLSVVLEKLASDRHDAGFATGLDVVRARVQLANDRQSLLVARNTVDHALLSLARNIGMKLATPLALAEALNFKTIEAPRIDEALNAALKERADFAALLAQRESLQEQFKSSRSRYLPKVTLSGQWGESGQRLSGLEPTGAVRANLIFTLFDFDRSGEEKEIQSRLKRIDQQVADQRVGIEQDIREAMLNLGSATDQVAVAQAGLELAEHELELAGDRFKQGVADNTEVVNAQNSLARAQQNRITALTNHMDAKIALARSLGNTETIYRMFLGIQ